MDRDYFWLSVDQFARLAAHLPTDRRGKPRVDDRRVISGIIHALKSGARWVDTPSAYGPRKTFYNRFVRWAAKGIWKDIFHALASAGGPPEQVLIDSSAVKAHRCASGAKVGELTQAIGRSRGARTTRIHALTDRFCRPMAFLLTGGQVADCTAADTLLDQMPAAVTPRLRKPSSLPCWSMPVISPGARDHWRRVPTFAIAPQATLTRS